MWKIKTVDVQKNLQAKTPGDRMRLHVSCLLENEVTTEETTIPFIIESKELMDKTLRSVVARLNAMEADLATTPKGEAYDPGEEVVDASTDPTPEQIALREYNKARAELIQLKQDDELGLARPNELSQKVATVRALREALNK